MSTVIQTIIACWCGLGAIGALLLLASEPKETFKHFLNKPFKTIGIAVLFVGLGPIGFFWGFLAYLIIGFFKR